MLCPGPVPEALSPKEPKRKVNHPLQQQLPTIAILGADTVVRLALSGFLEDFGYRPRLLEAKWTWAVDQLLVGADLLLLTPGLDEGVHQVLLGAAEKRGMPVVSLSTTAATEEPQRTERVLSVPWPCGIEELMDRIEAALLLAAPAASTTADAQ